MMDKDILDIKRRAGLIEDIVPFKKGTPQPDPKALEEKKYALMAQLAEILAVEAQAFKGDPQALQRFLKKATDNIEAEVDFKLQP